VVKLPRRKPRSREQQRLHLSAALGSLVTLAEAAAELHVAASRVACAMSEVLDEMGAFEEARPGRG